jgi:hypothetical protein
MANKYRSNTIESYEKNLKGKDRLIYGLIIMFTVVLLVAEWLIIDYRVQTLNLKKEKNTAYSLYENCLTDYNQFIDDQSCWFEYCVVHAGSLEKCLNFLTSCQNLHAKCDTEGYMEQWNLECFWYDENICSCSEIT